MTPENSLVQAYCESHADTRRYINAALLGTCDSGDDLVDKHFAPMVAWVFEEIRNVVGPDTLTAAQARMYIEELSVFARYNAQFLKAAATAVEGFCPELAHELRRNHLEEGGERGKVPAHYVLYSNALLSDLGLLVNGHVPADETAKLVLLHQVMVGSHMPSLIAGGYYATEAVAIAETALLRDITNRYGELTVRASGKELKALHHYYELHLDDEHDAAQIEGLSVEASHIEGLARFIRQNDLFHLDLSQSTDGFLQIFEAMAHWWSELATRARRIG
ncbi:protein of unknown function (DUF3865) [Parafrankia irregularis]|uniref:Iron-containing redox enzyme n=1 Tax=Parafrankia irregularis TaxID=795642 RepID=A0A0S4QZG6_9ACTN|nr:MULTISPECIES: DUF3865 domain-containing protein [Frankiaceae]KPM50345.1 hypothetical protein ACG83_40700 [Frankia sp. R43]MBE3204754.1 DUF3865 domain-containing protein [Parafrankia sp. CH37]CUU60919.1 protein of unknown function (DUF3865) [Parafrankia irregularis]